MNKDSFIGRNIISGGDGIGEIIDITSLTEGGDEFYKVHYPQKKCINYYSVNSSSGYRILANQSLIQKAIEKFKSTSEKRSYKSIQEKIVKEKELLKVDDILLLADTLSTLKDEKDLHVQLKKPFKDALTSFIDEIHFVLKMRKNDVYPLLNLKTPKKG